MKIIEEIFQYIFTKFDSSLSGCVSILTRDLSADKDVWDNVILQVNGIIKPIALIIITICFLIEFLKLTVKMDILKWEFLLRVFFKFVIAKAVLDYATIFLETIYYTVSDLILKVGDINTLGFSTVASAIMDKISSMGIIESIGFLMTNVVSMLAILIVGIIIDIIAYGRLFEIYVYMACAPIPFAFLPLEGNGSQITKKFILSFTGVCLQGLMIVLCLKIYQGIVIKAVVSSTVDASMTASSMMGELLLASLILITALFKCGSWGKTIVSAA